MEKDIPGKFQQQNWCGYINITQMDFKGGKKLFEHRQHQNRNLSTVLGDEVEKKVIVYFQTTNMFSECYIDTKNKDKMKVWENKYP